MDVKTIVEIVVAIFQVIIILYLAGIKSDIKDIWKRLNTHQHTAKCNGEDCREVTVGDVIIPHEVG
jgi:hypothetical protein